MCTTHITSSIRIEMFRVVVRRATAYSAVRAQLHPQQPPIQWGGAIMLRGTTLGVPIRSGASFVGVGSARHRVVLYPISSVDPATGLVTLNWIAETAIDNRGGWTHGDWSRRLALDEFATTSTGGTTAGTTYLPFRAVRRRSSST